MTDIRQSRQFASFMKSLGWEIQIYEDNYCYLRKFPLIGYFAKMPRPKPFFSIDSLYGFLTKQHIFQFKISPNIENSHPQYLKYQNLFRDHQFKIENFPFNPTTTLQINLNQKESKLFSRLSEAKRRGVRRAVKNGIRVIESTDIDGFITIRQQQYAPFGFLITSEMKKLWNNFYPDNASLLLAYNSSNQSLAGILLLFYEKTAYYWYASSLKEGKKKFAPTLLAWEAIKMSQKRGCHIFDFEGIYDDRFPKASDSWRGFTKFKEGFGGKKVIFMNNFQKLSLGLVHQ